MYLFSIEGTGPGWFFCVMIKPTGRPIVNLSWRKTNVPNIVSYCKNHQSIPISPSHCHFRCGLPHFFLNPDQVIINPTCHVLYPPWQIYLLPSKLMWTWGGGRTRNKCHHTSCEIVGKEIVLLHTSYKVSMCKNWKLTRFLTETISTNTRLVCTYLNAFSCWILLWHWKF